MAWNLHLNTTPPSMQQPVLHRVSSTPMETLDKDRGSDPLVVLTTLYDEHATAMFRWVVGMLGRREDAEDAVQAVWMKLARAPERLAEVEDLAAYLWAALRHHVTSVLRRRALERLWTPALGEADDGEQPAAFDPNISDDERRDLTRAVRSLRPRLRAVVLLVGFEGSTLEEAGRRLGIPRGTAASRYHAAIQKLRRTLGAGR